MNGRTASSGSKNKRRLSDFFMQNKMSVNYHDSDVLRRFLSPEGKILPARRSGLTSKNQRKLTNAIKRGRNIGLLPYASSEF